MSDKPDLTVRVSNFFGGLGYFWLTLLWFWALIIIGYPLLNTDFSWFIPETITPPPPTLDVNLPTPLTYVVVIIVLVVMIALTVYAFISLPRTLTKTSRKATSKATSFVVPIVEPRKKISKKRRRAVTANLKVYIKVFLVLIPVMVICLINNSPLDADLARFVVLLLGFLSLTGFGLQYTLAFVTKKDISLLW